MISGTQFFEILTSFDIPFGTLQKDGYLMIWIIDMKEIVAKKIIESKWYKYKAKVMREKLTRNGNPVNLSGVTTRHSTETLYIFSKGKVSSFSKYHKATDLIRAQVRAPS